MDTTGLMFPKQKTLKKRIKHPKSIMHGKESRTCYLCTLLEDDYKKHVVLHEHHIFGGPNRTHSEEEGLKVYLCLEHHMYGKKAVHKNAEIMKLLQKMAQREYEKNHSRQQFKELFGKSWLEEEKNDKAAGSRKA